MSTAAEPTTSYSKEEIQKLTRDLEAFPPFESDDIATIEPKTKHSDKEAVAGIKATNSTLDRLNQKSSYPYKGPDPARPQDSEDTATEALKRASEARLKSGKSIIDAKGRKLSPENTGLSIKNLLDLIVKKIRRR